MQKPGKEGFPRGFLAGPPEERRVSQCSAAGLDPSSSEWALFHETRMGTTQGKTTSQMACVWFEPPRESASDSAAGATSPWAPATEHRGVWYTALLFAALYKDGLHRLQSDVRCGYIRV